MDPLTKTVALSICSPLFVFVIHAVVSRFLKKLSPQLATAFAIILAQFPLLFILWWNILRDHNFSKPELFSTTFYALILFASSGYIYFHIFNTTETARRIRILHEIKVSGSLSKEDIISLYRIDDIVEVRLRRLIETQQLKFDGQTYRLNLRLLYRAAILVSAWRNMLGLNRSEI